MKFISRDPRVKVVDLFCGIGGLTHGLIKEGFNIAAGIDNDGDCKYGYEYNNKTRFIEQDILKVTGGDLKNLFGNAPIRVLVGCAPCQPFSKLNLKKITNKQLEPLGKFAQLIEAINPEVISMENVGGLANQDKYPIFKTFIETLRRNKYQYSYEVVDVSEYGVPQSRKRLVLLASKFGKIKLIDRTHKDKKITVKEAIKHLEPLKNGEVSLRDRLHRATKLNPINIRRIKATPHDGGNSSSWDEELIPKCHKKESGKTYRSTVYGRMRWNEPAPTMTTQCTGFGNGRFGHPEQDRAISLREAAIFQTFPKSYVFSDPSVPLIAGNVARFIGNAVPVKLGSVIGKSIITHLEQYERQS